MKTYQDFVEIEMKFPRFTKLQPKRPIGNIVSSRWKKKHFMVKVAFFSKGLTWHRSPWEEMGGNWSKMGF